MKKVLVLHGPNLNLLGNREPEVYGRVTLDEINDRLMKLAKTQDASLSCLQSNAESELVDRIQHNHFANLLKVRT
ncbi:MAG: type II 3-dehydroquinate dehydratase, partial [Gallionella sp.]